VSIDGVVRQLFLTGQCIRRGFVVDARRLYWIDDHAHAICSFAKRGGGDVRRLADAPPGEGQLAIAGDELCWSDADAGRVRTLRRGGGGGVLAEELAAPVELAVAGDDLLWINRGDGSLMILRR